MKDISVILPSYKPDEKLLDTVASLEGVGFEDIIVVDDGGGEEYAAYFDALRSRASCTVLVHEINRGKGAAIKTAMRWYLENRNGAGVVTADGDGQHMAEDVAAVCEKMREDGGVVLGVRDFSKPDVPPRSRFGNRCTSAVFKLFLGLRISDTQTGLRAIPASLIPIMLEVSGDRYEYETNMLISIKKNSLSYSEVKIDTVYIDDNKASHFRPFRDSAKIYLLILKYLLSSSFMRFMGSSMICYSLDWVLFTALHYWLLRCFGEASMLSTALPMIGARVVSSALNFCINSKIFDNGDGIVAKTVCKYYILAVCLLCTSTVSVHFISRMLSTLTSVTAAVNTDWLQLLLKLPVDLILYVVSYNIQKRLVFNNKKVGKN